MAKAVTVAETHCDDDGMCRGCLTALARLVPFPCVYQTWARSVLARYSDPEPGGNGQEP